MVSKVCQAQSQANAMLEEILMKLKVLSQKGQKTLNQNSKEVDVTM